MRFTHQPGAQPLAGYTIQRGIHRGGFGEVYYARSDGGKEVALKLLQRDQDVELRGVRQCLNLKHPNLVNLFDVRTDDRGEQWVVMEYVNGSSLEDVLASFPNGLPLEEVEEWLNGIAAGVAYLHDRGIVHRDLKPGNVYRENGVVKVGDVGLSKRLGSDRRGTHTQSIGTVYYMAPEVAHGQYGPEVDVYSLGIMLYEMLTGRVPFLGETTAEVLMKHLTATADLAAIPEPLRPVVAQALAKDPRQRTPSAVQVAGQFQQAVARVRNGRHPVGAAVARNGTAVANQALLTAETPSMGQGEFVDTSTSIVRPAVNGKSASQAAAAYAHSIPVEARPQPPQQPPQPLPRPVAPSAAPRPGSAVKQTRCCTPQPPVNWPLVAAGIAGLMLFAPGTWRAWSGLALIGTACGVASLLRGSGGRRLETSLVSMDSSIDVQVCTPSTETRQALGDAAASLSVGGVAACLLAVGAVLSGEFLWKSPLPPAPEFLAMMAAVSLGAVWLTLLAGRLSDHVAWLRRNPRKTFLIVGVLVGAMAWGLDQYLLVDYAIPSGYSPAFRSIGVHRLADADMSPTVLGYAVYFGGLMFWHRWWQDMSPRRGRTVSLGRLCTAGIAAWLLTVFFAFPQWTAVLWAITISAAVQLASPIAPRRC